MPHDHPGFDLWDVDDANHPFPVSDIDIIHDQLDFTFVSVDLTLPQAQPELKTAAERYIGIVARSQLWVAIECTTDAQNQVTCEAVLRGKHLHFYPEHGESAAGPLQEIRLTQADMRGPNRREAMAAHGPHCDLFSASWHLRPGKIHCELAVLHVRNTVQGFLDSRAQSKRDAERLPRPRVVIQPLPEERPPPPPEPKPDPLPDGAMKPERPGGLLMAIVGFFKRLAWGLFG